MKNKISLLGKLMICKYWLFEYGDVLIENCPFCKSTNIQRTDVFEEAYTYKAKYKCKKCGATGEATEVWSRRQHKTHDGS